MSGDGAAAALRDELAAGLEGDVRAARLALVDELLALGCSEQELREAHAQDRLALLPLERVLGAEGHLTPGEVADAHGVDVDDLIRTRRALGLPIDEHAASYGDALAQHAERLRGALESGVPVEALIDVNRVVGRGMAAIVGAGRDVIARAVEGGGDLDERTRALAIAAAVEHLTPLMRDVLVYAFDEHARELVRNEQAGTLGMAAGVANVRDTAIAFADLVGFTSLGDKLTPAEVSAVAGRLEALASDQLRPSVVLVKTIGDEVMLASPDAGALAETVLGLVAAADAEGGTFPRLRAGAAAGPAVRRSGDFYGAPVNLASRLTSLAEPGTLLADAAFRDAAPEPPWTSNGNQEVRGVSRPVATFATTAG